MALSWRRHADPLVRAVSIGILPTMLLYGNWIIWWGGRSMDHVFWRISRHSYRFAWCLVSFDSTPSTGQVDDTGGRWLFLALALWSIWSHAIGALWDDGRWNASPNIDLSLHRLWSVGSCPLI